MREEVNAAVGKRLAQIRKARGLTQKQAAAFLAISSNGLCNYEQGMRAIPYSLLARMVELYGVTYDAVLSLNQPLPSCLQKDRTLSRDTLEWQITGMLIEYRKTGRYYLLSPDRARIYWVRHDPAASGTVLISALHPGRPDEMPRRYPVEEFASFSVEQIAALLRGMEKGSSL